MLKQLAVLLAFLCFPASAEPIDDLLAAAHAGDAKQVEAMIRDTESRKQQRDLVWALAASHPDTRTFVADWAAAEPENALALTARAWSLYWEASLLRGDRFIQYTWPSNLEQAVTTYGKALALAERAVALDDRLLPASDAVILISSKIGKGSGAVAELERIMAIDPNHHSLVLTAAALSPAWGGSVELMQALCSHFVPHLTDVPHFDAKDCVAQSILRGSVPGKDRTWAIGVLSTQGDNPLFERELLALARHGELPFLGMQGLSARLEAEGRMSTHVFLAADSKLLHDGLLPQRDAFASALENDLTLARRAADRDPGYTGTLVELQDIYAIESDFVGLQVLRRENPTPAEMEAYTVEMSQLIARQEDDLDRRVRYLLRLVPTSPEALEFAARHVRAPAGDTLATDRWAISALINAAIYSNYSERQLGLVARDLKARWERLNQRMAESGGPVYEVAELDEVYTCAYVRALRLVEALCEQHPNGEENCLMGALLRSRSDREDWGSMYAHAEARDVCRHERTAPIEELLYRDIALDALP